MLAPVDAQSNDRIYKLKPNQEVMVSIKTPRNPQHHRLFFAVLNDVVQSGAWEGTLDSLLTTIKIGTGHVDTIIDQSNGKTYYVTKSIDFASMSQDKFNEFFDLAIQLIAQRWMDQESIDEIVMRNMAERRG